MRDALALPAWVVGLSLLGVGSLAHDAGFPAGAAVLSTFLIWAAPAQVILFAGAAAGTALPVLAVAVCLSSIRFLPMTMTMLPLIRRPGQGLGFQAFAAHYVAMTLWVEGQRRLPGIDPEDRPAYYLGFGNACILLSGAATALGYHLVSALPLPLAAAILFMTPIFFTIALVGGARTLADGLALALGAGLAPLATLVVGRDFDLLAVGLVGGTIAYIVGRRARRRRA
ncbi:AzlC family ABC transporter permease [Salinarimonas soli]|uniref:AzlC family ABC transporter permease n=1 Tax=Salinarimonas soli TaxID=1638099 RepID=A0A5B2V9R1_9HYPH|nr:AzlC family ABC transporter permease [Salinarimonas soli]KAA2235724.1 AzlC family ABC transporter permease [Salinarimonas soli]